MTTQRLSDGQSDLGPHNYRPFFRCGVIIGTSYLAIAAFFVERLRSGSLHPFERAMVLAFAIPNTTALRNEIAWEAYWVSHP